MPDHRRNRLRILIPIATVGALGLAPAVAGAEDVEVRSGDTLWNLTAAQYGEGISYDHVEAVAALNEIPDPNLIYVGDVLSMPAQLDLSAPQEAAEAAPEPVEREPGTDWDGDGVVEPEPSDDGSDGDDAAESSDSSDSSDEPDYSGEDDGDDGSGGSSVWDQLAQCESGGDWHINTGNGYFGGLQFLLSTWQAYGGSGYPHENSREEQIRVAENLRADAGYSPWPACSAQLGLG